MYDTGTLTIDGKADFAVEDVQVFGGFVLHIGYLKYGSLAVNDKVTCSFDEVGGFFWSIWSFFRK
jgi:alanyl-tRNA synthetase